LSILCSARRAMCGGVPPLVKLSPQEMGNGSHIQPQIMDRPKAERDAMGSDTGT